MRDFNHSVGVLVKAYLDGTLASGTCYACAVGNLVADAIGCTVVVNDKRIGWSDMKTPPSWGLCVIPYVSMTYYAEEVKRQIDATGYTPEELHVIEDAFEYPWRYSLLREQESREEKEFKGLMNVVDVLAQIHGIDLTVASEAKQRFKKPALV